MASFSTPIASTAIRTWTITVAVAALDAALTSTFAAMDSAAFDVIGLELAEPDVPGKRDDLIAAVVIGKAR